MTASAKPHSRARVRGLISAVLSAVVVGVSLLGAAPAAQAATTATLDNVYFETNTFPDGSRQSLHVDWSIPAAATAPVTLSLDLPEELRGYADSFPMVGPNGEQAGNCVVSATGVECTVDDQFVRDNPYGVSGQFWFDVQSQLKNKEAEEHTFNFGGFSETVVVDPNRAWCTDNCAFTGESLAKWGSYDNATDTIIWTVRVPAGEQGIEAGKVVTVTDVLNTDQFEIVPGEGFPRVREGGSLSYNEWDREVVNYATKPADQVTWSSDSLTATFTSVAGAGQDAELGEGSRGTDGSFYLVQWRVKVLDEGKAKTYTNSANYTIDGEESGSTNGSATRYSGGANVVGQNFGRFEVTKDLQGDTVLNPTFTINYQAFDGDTLIDQGIFDIRSGQSYISNEYFKGTRIVLSEIQPTGPDNVTWSEPVFLDADGQPVTELTFSAENGNLGQVTQIQLVNRAELRTGEIVASKVVDNPDGVPLDINSYRINFARENAVDRGIQNITGGGFTLPADGTPVTVDLPGGVGYSFFEPFIPAPAGTTWADPVYTVNGVEVAENELVNLPVDGTIELVVTNRITQNVGGFSITKSVSGEGASLVPEGAEFTVSYTYTAVNGFPAGEGTVTVRAGETSPVVDDIPAGSEVTLTEVRPTTVEGGTWGEPEFDVATFTVTKDGIAEVNLDNPISWNSGDFSVLKRVDGTGADLVSDDVAFTVEYTYVTPEELGIEPATGTGTLTVLNNGEAVTSDPLPYNTKVTLSEVTPADVEGGEWTASTFDHDSFTIGDETTFAITLTNTFEKDPASESGSGSGSGQLPQTGMGPWILPLGAVGIGLVALGVVLYLRRRQLS